MDSKASPSPSGFSINHFYHALEAERQPMPDKRLKQGTLIPNYENVALVKAGGTHRILLSHQCLGMMTTGCERLTIDVHRYQEGGFSVTNVHGHCEQGYFIMDGEGEVNVGNETYKVTKGSYVFIPRNAPHSLRNTGKGELVLLFMSTLLGSPENGSP